MRVVKKRLKDFLVVPQIFRIAVLERLKRVRVLSTSLV